MPLHSIENGICTCRPTPNRPKGGALCPSPGKHPRIKTGRAFEAATTDRAQIETWFKRWPNANIGIATGQRSRLCVVDLDGQEGIDKLKSLLAERSDAAIPNTLSAASGRTGIGAHLYFYCAAPSPTNSGDKLDVRGDGGLVVAPPSLHISGRSYRWLNTAELARMPEWLLEWFRTRDGREQAGAVQLPPHLQGRARSGLTARLAADREPVALDDIWSALTQIPNGDRGWDGYNRVGMAIWAACDGDPAGEDLFDRWSQGSKKYQPEAAAERWRAYAGTPPTSIGYGSLWYEARQNNPAWSPPSKYIVENVTGNQQPMQQLNGHSHGTNGHAFNGGGFNGSAGPAPSLFRARSPDNPLIELNERFCVIGNLGGKVYVMEWVPSKADPNIEIPSYQSFKSFSERYANRYVDHIIEKTNKKTGETEREDKTDQLGTYWLKWHARRTYEGMDLDPNGPEVLEGNVLNLWKGFGVEAKPGKWTLMQRHITDVLAGGSQEQALYILRWAAWAVQNPGLQAEVALVLRGGKGVGKGTFAHALRRIFGQHGVYVSNSKHLVGQFNAHLRSCLLLFADEAFWAGDKQGESTLKSLITEAVVPIEKKGVDMEHVVNRLHIVMAANADWVVPASHDERRFAIFDIQRAPGKGYFKALREELENGGLEAMLHDLQHMDLGDWHPRIGIDTPALQKQKEMSLSPLADWFVGLLQDGYQLGREGRVPATALLSMCQQSSGRLRDVSPQTLGRFLKKHGVKPVHTAGGSVWEFGELPFLRKIWEKEFGKWDWDSPELTAWRVRS